MKLKLIQQIIGKKLHCVKAIKNNSNLDLRESKDLFDRMNNNVGLFINIDMTKDQINNFKKETLEEGITSFKFSFEDRNLNLLKLGIGEESEYIEALAEFMSGSDTETIKNMLVTLNKNTLIQLCERIAI